MIRLEIPRVPPSLNEVVGYHWRHRHRVSQIWQKEIWYALITAGYSPQRLPYAKARVSIHRQSHGKMDPDNLVGAMKPLIDALRYAHVLVDDTEEHLELVVTQKRQLKSAAPFTRIEVEEIA